MVPTYYLLDTFTAERFQGNPTPVCILPKPLSDQCMYDLAKEFNAPVTAFVEYATDKEFRKIRYFTVTGEIPACGHATLGAAFVLLGQAEGKQLIFETIEGINLRARMERGIVFLEYPKYLPSKFEIPNGMSTALGITDFESNFFCEELQSLFIELNSERAVQEISPNFGLLNASSDKVKEVVVMSQSERHHYDFILRSFCPWIGIDEDPVTGSIHSVLGGYWQERLHKDKLIAYQASARGGQLFIHPYQSTVEIGGHAMIVVEGVLNV